MSDKLITALKDCVSVMERELSGLAVIQPELIQAREALAGAMQKPAGYDDTDLPPVGVVCEVVDDGSLVYGHGESGLVVAYVENCAVVRMSYGLGCFTASCLRTIRAPEQIAAEKRIKAAQEWLRGVEREYGVEVADQCENILMAAESHRAVPAELIADDNRAAEINAMKEIAIEAFKLSRNGDDITSVIPVALYDAGCRMPQGGEQ